MEASTLTVPNLETEELPEHLRIAVEAFVTAKHLEDSGLRGVPKHLRPIACFPRSLGEPPVYPWEFFRLCFPFADHFTEHLENAFVAHAPTARTIGCSWRWRTAHVPDSEQLALVEKLQRPPKSTDDASYAWVRPLGLFVPNEGKNRVDFFRERGAATIPTFVLPRAYPAANRLSVYDVGVCGREEQWVVLDDRWLQRAPLLFPRAAGVLQAYGVAPSTEWPQTYPSPAQVCDALAHKHETEYLRHNHVVDLQEIRAQDPEVFCSIAELQNVHVRPRFWWLSLSGILLGGLALAAFPDHWATAREVAVLCLGAGIGALFTVQQPALCARKRWPR